MLITLQDIHSLQAPHGRTQCSIIFTFLKGLLHGRGCNHLLLSLDDDTSSVGCIKVLPTHVLKPWFLISKDHDLNDMVDEIPWFIPLILNGVSHNLIHNDWSERREESLAADMERSIWFGKSPKGVVLEWNLLELCLFCKGKSHLKCLLIIMPFCDTKWSTNT